MVQSMDKERAMGIIEHEKSIVDFFTGAGTGIIMIGIGWYKKSKSDKKVVQYIKEYD